MLLPRPSAGIAAENGAVVLWLQLLPALQPVQCVVPARSAAAMRLRLDCRLLQSKTPHAVVIQLRQHRRLVMHNAPTTEPTFHVQDVCVDGNWLLPFVLDSGNACRMPLLRLCCKPAALRAVV